MPEMIIDSPYHIILIIFIIILIIIYGVFDFIEQRMNIENEKIKDICQRPMIYDCEVLKNVSDKCKSVEFEWSKRCLDQE